MSFKTMNVQMNVYKSEKHTIAVSRRYVMIDGNKYKIIEGSYEYTKFKVGDSFAYLYTFANILESEDGDFNAVIYSDNELNGMRFLLSNYSKSVKSKRQEELFFLVSLFCKEITI